MIRPGELTLRMVADDVGRTRAAVLHQRYPQRVTTPLHCDEQFPDAAMVCVQSPSGGTFSDDELSTTVSTGAGAHLRLTTQSATQVFAGTGSGARHRQTFEVESGAVLEYLPSTVIPHAGSRYTQKTEIDLDIAGCYLGWEAVAAGRLGFGERFRYQKYDSTLRVNVKGRTVARDRQLLEPPAAPVAQLVGADYFATLVAIAPAADCVELLGHVRCVLDNSPAELQSGASELPDSAGVLVRIATDSAPTLHRTQTQLLNTLRHELIVRPARKRSSMR